MRRRRRHWRPTSGAIILLVAVLAIGAGIIFGRTIIGAFGNRTPVTVGGQSGDAQPGGQSGTGAQTGQTGGTGAQPGQTGQTGQTGQSGGTGPTVAEVPFKLPQLVTFTVQAGRFDNRVNAEKLVGSLTKAGYPSWNSQAPPYKVFVGCFADKKNAAALATKLKTERPDDCGAAWTTSIAAPSVDKTVTGTDQAGLQAIGTALQTVSQMASKEAALWDARAKGTLKSADVKALSDEYTAKLSKAAADVRAAAAGDALRDKALSAVVAAQNNLAKVAAFASGGTAAQYVEAASTLITLSETYADAVAALTPIGN